ncbi:MAG: hypothetical protein L6R39_002357 [Caloplaca ligustica]|nr:MAG: hypothetical protein L6R39_002357 [Caloplaca ligustica]
MAMNMSAVSSRPVFATISTALIRSGILNPKEVLALFGSHSAPPLNILGHADLPIQSSTSQAQQRSRGQWDLGWWQDISSIGDLFSVSVDNCDRLHLADLRLWSPKNTSFRVRIERRQGFAQQVQIALAVHRPTSIPFLLGQCVKVTKFGKFGPPLQISWFS